MCLIQAGIQWSQTSSGNRTRIPSPQQWCELPSLKPTGYLSIDTCPWIPVHIYGWMSSPLRQSLDIICSCSSRWFSVRKLDMAYLWGLFALGWSDGLVMLGRRGVGRTGAPPAIIQDFCRDPPKKAFNVALEETTSRSVMAELPSLSGGRRMS